MKGKRIAAGILLLLAVLCGAFSLACDGTGDETCKHEWGEWSVTQAATCTEDGTETRVCALDASHTETRTIAKLGHKFTTYVSDNNATCTADGTKTAVCDREGCEVADTIADTGSATGHSFTLEAAQEKYLKTAATCTAKAVYYKSCACGEKGTETFEAGELAAHDYAEAWESDGTDHWHKCKNCTAVKDRAAHAGGTASCTQKAVCSVCNTAYGELLEHSFTQEVAEAKYLKTEATCTAKAVYYKSCVCGERGTETFEAGELLPHTFGEWEKLSETQHRRSCACGETETENHAFEETVEKAATCTEQGMMAYTCPDCGAVRRETIHPTGHVWSADAVTCTEGRHCTVEGCDASEPALNHDYRMTNETAADCEHDGVQTFTCSHCQDTYDVTTELARGHHADEWIFDSETPVANETCKYEQIFLAICTECGHELSKSEVVEKHTLKASIKTAATCQTPGVMLYSCTAEGCGHTEERPYTDAEAHRWNGGTTEGGVTTYTCENEGCGKTRQVVSAKDQTGTTVSNETLKSVGEVELKEATIALDEGTVGALEGDVAISADKLTAEDLTDIALSDALKEKLGTNPVYNFSMEAGGIAVTDFNGIVTVRIPYVLADGEDPECIAVWYIDGNGEVRSIQAVYSNGYAVFTTDHFSYYTVTRLTPAERCELYGHSYTDTVKEATCVSNGYTLHVCQRCGHSEKTDIVRATGHSFSETTTDATCVLDGKTVYSCGRCDYSYEVKLPATGHEWQVGETKNATCTEAGYVAYGCAHCDASYKTTLAQKQHNYGAAVTAPTCTEQGFTTYTCLECGHSYKDAYKRPLGHAYEKTVVPPTCTEDGYTENVCTRCGDSHQTDPVPAGHVWDIEEPTCGRGQVCTLCGEPGLPATGRHQMHDGVCTVCGDGCTHDFAESIVAPTCTERGYTLKVCSLCGLEEKSDYTAALGHTGKFTCSVCHQAIVGEDFFANALGSLLNQNFAICVSDVHWVMQEYNATSVYSIDFAELFLAVDENGALYGYGSGTILYSSDMPFPTGGTITAVIRDSMVYIKGDFTAGNGVGQWGSVETSDERSVQYIVLPLEMLSTSLFGSNSGYEMIDALPVVYGWFKTELLPIVNDILALNRAELAASLAPFAEVFFKVERNENGFVLTLDAERILALNESLYTGSIRDNIDAICGEGAFDALKSEILAIAGSTMGDVLARAEEKGVEIEVLLPAFDRLAYALTGGQAASLSELLSAMTGTEVDVEALLKSEEFRNTTVLELINSLAASGGGSIPDPGPEPVDPPKEDVPAKTAGSGAGESTEITLESLSAVLDQMASATLYQLIAGDETAAQVLKAQVDQVLGTILQYAGLSVQTAHNGYIASIQVVLEETDAFGGTVSLLPGYESTVDYSALAAELERLTAKLDVDAILKSGIPENAEVTYYEDGWIESVTYSQDVEDIMHEEETKEGTLQYIRRFSSSSVYRFPRAPMLMIGLDCGNWVNVQISANVDRTYSEQEIRRLLDRDGNVIDQEIWDKEYGDYHGTQGLSAIYDLSTGRIESTDYFGGESKHNYVEDESRHKPAEGCTGFGERYFSCTHCGKAYIRYYTNGHVEGELTYTFDSDHDCESGVTITTHCKVCGEVIRTRHNDWHDCVVVDKEFDLSGTGACENHRVYVASCPCGTRTELIVETVYEDDHFEQHDPYDYSCPDCGLTVRGTQGEQTYDGCTVTETTVYTVSVQDTVIGTHEVSQTYESHHYMDYVYLSEGSVTCEDGCYVKRICRECGKEEIEEECYDHRTGIAEVIDLTEYGAKEGLLTRYGCACGRKGGKDWEIQGKFESNYFSEEGREVAVYTFLMDGFVVRTETYDVKEGCTVRRLCTVLIGYNEQDGSSKAQRDSVLHEYEQHDETVTAKLLGKTCEDGVVLTFTCKVCGNVREETVYDHLMYEKERTGLSEYGAVCEGYFVVTGCACGRDEYANIQSQCDFDRNEIYYRSEYDNFYVYICAVTDPVQCTFLYGEKLYQEGCTVYRTLYLGCDRDGENAQREVTSVYQTRHETEEIWEPTEEQCWFRILERCTVCGEIVNEYWDYRHEREYIREETGTPCYYHVLERCKVCGEVLYDSYEWDHSYVWTTTKEPTCTQYGERHYECTVCHEQLQYEYLEPTAHSGWIFDEVKGMYVCPDCGLENKNGSSGEVVLEDCSDPKDPDLLVAGYWLRGYWIEDQAYEGRYVPSVTLILHKPDAEGNEQILVEGVSIGYFGEEGNYVSFSRSEVERLALEMGYEASAYDIRLSFVPVGGDGSLDYGITFTDGEAAQKEAA